MMSQPRTGMGQARCRVCRWWATRVGHADKNTRSMLVCEEPVPHSMALCQHNPKLLHNFSIYPTCLGLEFCEAYGVRTVGAGLQPHQCNMQRQQLGPLSSNNTYHKKVLVSEGMGSRGGPCQHLQEPPHDPGGVALPWVHPPCHGAKTSW